MAISENDKSNALKGAISYAATIAGQTQRIADAHEIIQAKAIALGLNIQKGEGDAKPALTTLLTDSHKIMDTASAINAIRKNPENSIINLKDSLSVSGDTVTLNTYVPVNYGYYASDYRGIPVRGDIKIPAATTAKLSLEGEHTAGAASITVTTNGTHIEYPGYITTGSNGAASKTINLKANNKEDNPLALGTKDVTKSDGSKVTYVTFTPIQGFYTPDAWVTKIIQNPTPTNPTITVVQSDETGESLVEGFTVKAGYYANDFTVKPLIAGVSGDYVINIDTTVGELNALSGQLPGVSNGYNYFSGNANYTIKTGSITKVTSSGPTATNNTITFSGGVTTAGWISNNVSKPAKITLALVSLEASLSVIYSTTTGGTTTYTPELTITPGSSAIYIPKERWTGKGIKINPISSSTAAVFNTSAYSTSNTNGVTISSGQAVVKVTTAGYKDGNALKATLPVTSATPTLGSDGDTTPKLTITPTAGYYNGKALTTSVNYYEQNAKTETISVTTTTSKETVNVSGTYTIAAGYYAGTSTLTFEGTASVGTAKHGFNDKLTMASAASGSFKKDHWYVEYDVTVAGYTPTGSKYLDIGSNGTGATLTRSSASKEIAPATYYGSKATISTSSVAGILGDGSGDSNNSANISTSNSSTATADNTLRLENLKENTTFYAAENKFLSSFTVQVDNTIAALQKI